MAKQKLSKKAAQKCQHCQWREKTLEGVIMCPIISCMKERIEESKKHSVRHKQA